MMLEANKPKRTIGKERKIFSLDEKLSICQEWKRSGLSMSQFCKTKNFTKSALYQWCRHLRQKLKQSNQDKSWIPVKATREREVELEETILIELSLPNQSVARIKISRSEAISFLQELSDAATVIR